MPHNQKEMMKDCGLDKCNESNVRRVDECGRVLIPMWLRRKTGFMHNTVVEVTMIDEDTISIKKRPAHPLTKDSTTLSGIAETMRTTDMTKVKDSELEAVILASKNILQHAEHEIKCRQDR